MSRNESGRLSSPICLVTNDVKLMLNVRVDLLLASQSKASSNQSDAELVPVGVVRKLLDELSPYVRHCVHRLAVRRDLIL